MCYHDKRHPEGLDTIPLCKDNEEWHRSMVEIKDRHSKNRTALIASFLDRANREQFLIQVTYHFSYKNLEKIGQ